MKNKVFSLVAPSHEWNILFDIAEEEIGEPDIRKWIDWSLKNFATAAKKKKLDLTFDCAERKKHKNCYVIPKETEALLDKLSCLHQLEISTFIYRYIILPKILKRHNPLAIPHKKKL